MTAIFAFAAALSIAAEPTYAQMTAAPASSYKRDPGTPASAVPKPLREVGFDQNLSQRVPLDIPFADEQGRLVRLGDYFGPRPVVLALVYYDCPMLCTQVLNGMVTSFRVLPFQMGQEFEVVTVSFDPRETNTLAAKKKQVYLDYLPEKMRAGARDGWHFLTGDQANIAQLTEAVGFRHHYDEATKQFAHASGLIAHDKPVQSLEVAGPDRVFYPANGRIEREMLVVTSPAVREPVDLPVQVGERRQQRRTGDLAVRDDFEIAVQQPPPVVLVSRAHAQHV